MIDYEASWRVREHDRIARQKSYGRLPSVWQLITIDGWLLTRGGVRRACGSVLVIIGGLSVIGSVAFLGWADWGFGNLVGALSVAGSGLGAVVSGGMLRGDSAGEIATTLRRGAWTVVEIGASDVAESTGNAE